MTPKFLSWLARPLQTLKVFVFRLYYRISNALAWRGPSDKGKAFAIKLKQAGVPVDFQHFPHAAHGFTCSEGPHTDFRSFINHVNNWLSSFSRSD